MRRTRKQHGGESKMVSMAEVIAVVRSKQPGALLEKYQPALSKCPMCNTDRKIVKGKPVLPKQLCNDACIVKTLNDMLYRDDTLAKQLLAPIALERGLINGRTLKFDWYGYRNEGLYFWDAKNKEIVPPFTEVDDYGSVPPRFVVGDGYFNPTDWLDEVDHNSYVFPSRTLIKEIKAFVDLHPNDHKMIVEINGTEYLVKNTQKLKGDELDSIMLEVGEEGDSLYIFKGRPEWRDSIVEEKPENDKAVHGALLGMVAKHANGPVGNNIIKSMIPNRGGRRTRRARRNTF